MRLVCRPDGVANRRDGAAHAVGEPGPTASPGRTAARRFCAAVTSIVTVLALSSCGSAPDHGAGAGAQDPPAEETGAHTGHTFSPPPAAPPRDGERFQTLTLPAAYSPQAPEEGADEYRCFILDADLAGPTYLTGTQFVPQNVDIVHHAVLFQVPGRNAERARQQDRLSPGLGWPCFGNAGLDGGSGRADDAAWIGSWAPGTAETLLAPNLGYPMPAKDLLVIQIHYNLLATDGRPAGSDRSSIRLRLRDDGAGMTPLSTELLLAPVELPCTPTESGPLCDRDAAVADASRRLGTEAPEVVEALNLLCNRGRPPAAGNTQRCDRRVDEPATIHALGAHMHLLGRALKVELNPGTSHARTLLDVPAYNFDDQALRPLPKPVQVGPGDVLRVTCTHDASLRSQLPQLAKTPPRYVVWGEGTADEMCLGVVIQS